MFLDGARKTRRVRSYQHENRVKVYISFVKVNTARGNTLYKRNSLDEKIKNQTNKFRFEISYLMFYAADFTKKAFSYFLFVQNRSSSFWHRPNPRLP